MKTAATRAFALNNRSIPVWVVTLLMAASLIWISIYQAASANDYRSRFYPVRPATYIASLAQPDANSGDAAETWGYWPLDPGPRGVKLRNYDDLVNAGNVAPAKWLFDPEAWWIEENGLIMEAPEFPLAAGQYLVTGGREELAVLTVYQPDETGNQKWELDGGRTIYDVTHLGCRSAVYTPASEGAMCTPDKVPQDVFRLTPEIPMPEVEGCNKQDYAVLIVVGLPFK